MKNIFCIIGLLICFISSRAQDKAFSVVEKVPEFPGGDQALLKVIQNNIHYPDDAFKMEIRGRVILGFVVDTNGSVTNVGIKKSLWPSIDTEAIRVIKLLPKFKPGTQQGKVVRVEYVMPIMFNLSDGDMMLLQNPAAGDAEKKANKAYKNQNYYKALSLYKSICEQDPENNFALHNLGLCQFMTEDKDAALATWVKLMNRGFHTADFLLDKYFKNR